jgi:hypothetical protein
MVFQLGATFLYFREVLLYNLRWVAASVRRQAMATFYDLLLVPHFFSLSLFLSFSQLTTHYIFPFSRRWSITRLALPIERSSV